MPIRNSGNLVKAAKDLATHPSRYHYGIVTIAMLV
jgi:hypothetical protein